tara:strand:+ start:2675 stop:3055 length:381 start_codon:yes stop_codon:yes gene_type:complete
MSNISQLNLQYSSNKIKFPNESFLIAGISNYQNNLDIPSMKLGSDLQLKLEPDNIYDSNAIQILFNKKLIGYVPKKNNIVKKMCMENINNNLKIINIKRESDSKNYGIRVILDKFYTDELLLIGIF